MKQQPRASTFGETLLCMLVYFFPVWVFGLFFIRRARRIHFHVTQGINLTLTTVLFFALAGAVGFAVNVVSWRWSFLSGVLSLCVAGLYLLLALTGAVRAARRRERPLPMVIRFILFR